MKLGHVPLTVRPTVTVPTSNTPISAVKQHTGSTDAELGKKRANGGSVVAWDGPLVVPIRCRSGGLGSRPLGGDALDPIEVRFVCIIR